MRDFGDQDSRLSRQDPIVFIVGPTASGKSSLAMQVAKKYDGEIICADSQTIRRGLDIGTAKPTEKDQKQVAHHMLDIIGPYDKFSAAEFKRRAEEAIQSIIRRGKLPIVVGGTGLYIDALLFDFSFADKADEELRSRLNTLSVAELQLEVQKRKLTMPNNDKNPRHLIRVIEKAGRKTTKNPQREDAVVVGVDPGRDELIKRIEDRVQKMVSRGLADEVVSIITYYGNPPDAWDAIGYKSIVDSYVVPGIMPNSEQIQEALTVAHRQYAKKQRAWFKRNENIHWFEQIDDAFLFIDKQLSSN